MLVSRSSVSVVTVTDIGVWLRVSAVGVAEMTTASKSRTSSSGGASSAGPRAGSCGTGMVSSSSSSDCARRGVDKPSSKMEPASRSP